MNYDQHPLSAIFPSLPDDELKVLAADIKAHGLHSAITIYKGQVLDGWHRYQACGLAGVTPRTMEYKGSDPVAYVKSANWHRRHMSASQRSFTETGLSKWRPPGTPGQTGINAGYQRTNAEMAAEAGTSERTIRQAKAVHINGAEQLKDAVKEGKISLNSAADIAKLPKAKQAKAIAEPKKKKPKAEEEFPPNMAEALQHADDQIRALQELVGSLKKSDLAAEVVKWKDRFERLEGRLRQCNATKTEAEKQAKYSTGLLAKIRKALKVETNAQILEAIRQ